MRYGFMTRRRNFPWLLVAGCLFILFQGYASQGIALADGEEEERAVANARRYEPIGDILGRYGDALAAEARDLD